MGDGGERVLMGDGVSTTRLDGWWEGAGASWWVMGIAVWGACFTCVTFYKVSEAGIMIFLTLCSEIARSPAISEISPAILEKIIMSFSNHRWFQFSNHRWFQFWHVSGCDLGASTLKGTESYTYSIGRWSTKHKFGAAHLARESSANWIQTRYCFGYLNHRWFRNHRW